MTRKPYSPKTYTPEDSIGYLLRRTGNQLTITLDRALARFDMTHAQFGIFIKLMHGKIDTAGDLARETMMDTGAMTRMLDRLEEKEFIRRTRSEEDRRVVKVELTPKGREMSDQMIAVACEALNHLLRGFSTTEVDLFKGFLRRMIANGANTMEHE